MSGSEAEHPGLQIHVALPNRAKRILAIHQLLAEKGIVGAGEVDDILHARGSSSRAPAEGSIEQVRSRAPADGARVVARAWVDAQFKARLLDDARSAVGELGYGLSHDAELAVVENTEDAHHLVVCTLCSCYPTALLGPPPDWYKSFAYRQRAVVAPRAVMREFGLRLDDGVPVRVIDSTADLRYLVLPRRPAGSAGLTERELAELVTRDSMIGVGEARQPDG